MDAGDFFASSRSDLPGITCLSLSVTLISDSGCPGLTDNHLVEGKGLWLFFFSLSEIHYGFILFSICERFGNGNIYNSFRYIVKIFHYTV